MKLEEKPQIPLSFPKFDFKHTPLFIFSFWKTYDQHPNWRSLFILCSPHDASIPPWHKCSLTTETFPHKPCHKFSLHISVSTVLSAYFKIGASLGF